MPAAKSKLLVNWSPDQRSEIRNLPIDTANVPWVFAGAQPRATGLNA